MKKNIKKVVGLSILGIIVILICVYLLYAFWFRWEAKRKFAYGEGFEEADGAYTKHVGIEIYGCYLPKWWQIGGNLAITGGIVTDANGRTEIGDVIEVPLKKGKDGYEVYITLHYRDENDELKLISFDLNEEMQFLHPEEVSTVQELLYVEYKDRIRTLYQKVYDTWGILNPDEADS